MRRISLLCALALGSAACVGDEGKLDVGDEASTSDEVGAEASSTTTTTETTQTTETTTETSESLGTETGSESSDASDFVPQTDSLLDCEASCTPFCGCAEGEKCVAYSDDDTTWNANKCALVLGEGSPGDACTWTGLADASDDCDANSHCWNLVEVDGQVQGTCVAGCGGTPDAPICDPGSSCLIANEGSLALCLPTCDPLVQDCADGQACYAGNEAFNCVFTSSNHALGEACEFVNDCALGSLCIDAAALPTCAGGACCAAYCDLATPSCATAGTECSAVFELGSAPLGLEDLGVCLVPDASLEPAITVTPP